MGLFPFEDGVAYSDVTTQFLLNGSNFVIHRISSKTIHLIEKLMTVMTTLRKLINFLPKRPC